MKQQFLQPGDMVVTTEPMRLVTVLGSCVSVCLFDPVRRVGAMCHFFLPGDQSQKAPESSNSMDSDRFGLVVIPKMLARLKALGSRREDIEVKVAGGAHVLDHGENSTIAVGDSNVRVALEVLAAFGLSVAAMSVGGTQSRKLEFDTGTGLVRVKCLDRETKGVSPRRSRPFGVIRDPFVAIGASTGGTEAVKTVLLALKSCPAMVIVIHIPPVFSKAYAGSLGRLLRWEVKEAEDGDEAHPGRILIAPGGRQLGMTLEKGRLIAMVNDDPPVNRFKPSVDYFFHSLARMRFRRLIAAILTGMGSDGAQGLYALRQRGAYTLVQDEKTSTVYGMPKAAVELGAACAEAALPEMAGAIEEAVRMDWNGDNHAGEGAIAHGERRVQNGRHGW